MITRRHFLKSAGVAVATSALIGHFGSTGLAQNEVKVGFFSPLTGFAAPDGESARDGAQVAVEAINADGGIEGLGNINFVNYDDAAQPDQASSIVQRLIERDQVDVVISGSYSSPTRSAAPICQRAGVPMISSYAVHPSITQVGDMVFRVGTRAEVQGTVGGYMGVQDLGHHRVAMLVIDNDFGVALADSFKAKAQELGAEIVYEKRYQLGESEFRSLLNEIKDRNPEALYATAYFSEAAHIVSQAEDVGLYTQIIGQEGYDSPNFLELADGDSENGTIITTDLNRDSDRQVVQNFLEAYQENTGRRADMVGASSHDAVRVAAHAMSVAGSTDAQAMQEAIMGIENFEEVATGPFLRYTEGREVVRPITPQIVRNSRFRFFAEYTDSELITPPA